MVALDDLASQGQQTPSGARALSGVVRPEAGYESLAHLLAGAGWCQDLEAAWRAGRSLAPGQVVVSPGGQRLDKPGLGTVGAGQGRRRVHPGPAQRAANQA